MIEPLNHALIDVACLGNHDLDFPVEEVEELIKNTRFPWLISNIKDRCENLEPLVGCKEYHILEKNGIKIGFMGLAEKVKYISLKILFHSI